MTVIDYKAAGVDVSAGNEAVKRIKKAVEKTFSPQVLTGIGSFASMLNLRPILNHYEYPVLVQSIDGVGTKMMVANKMQKYDTIGADLVSAVTNDILVLGAKPLTLLDYIANDKLKPETIEQIVTSIADACLEHNIALVGGETAEMPGTYCPGEIDLVGIVTGVVEKDKAITGKNINPGDVVACFPSSGLHTNGYSLARKLFFDVSGFHVDSYLPELNQSIGECLLTPHINYTHPILHLLENSIDIKGMAHITGGGLLENIPRVLPSHCAVAIQKSKIPQLPIFNVLKKLGHLGDKEMYRTFNMGAGMVLILTEEMFINATELLKKVPNFPLLRIGSVVSGHQEVTLND